MTSYTYREISAEKLTRLRKFLDDIGFRLLMPGDKLQSDDEFFDLRSEKFQRLPSKDVNTTIGTGYPLCIRDKHSWFYRERYTHAADWFDTWKEPTPVSVPKEPEEKPLSEGDRLYKFFFGSKP